MESPRTFNKYFTNSPNFRTRRSKAMRKDKQKKEMDPVEVYCRIRPVDESLDKCVSIVGPLTIQLTPPENSQAWKNGNYKESQYSFKFVFEDTTSQKAVFDHVAMPLVEDLLHGKNGLLFTYGITSSGKTHTMTGVPQDQGVLPRSLDVIFNSIQDLQAKKYVFIPDRQNGFNVQCEADAMVDRQRKDLLPKLMTPKTPGTPRRHARMDRHDDAPRVKEISAVPGLNEDTNFAVFVSYVEIYNNFIYDLLEDLPYDPITGYKPPQSKTLREDSYHNMYVHNCVEVEVKNTEDAFDVFVKGQKRRKVAHTALNAESSRSHSVFTIRLVQAPLDPIGEEVIQDKEKVCVSQLALVDLAGSERTNRTKSHGDRLREAGNINQTLMSLRTCIECLRENQQNDGNKIVPYRDARLTHLFKNYFEGMGRVKMVVCVNPKAEEYDETLQVMRFAELTKEIQITRAQQVRFDLDYVPGRRKMNQQYKDQLANQEPATPSHEAPIRLYDIGPPFPMLELLEPSDMTTISTLIHFLQERDRMRQSLTAELLTKQDQFRTRLLDIDQDHTELQCRFTNLESVVRTKESEVSKLERKIRNLETQNRDLHRTISRYDHDVKELKHEIEEKEQAVKKEKTEKNRVRHDFENKLLLNNRQWERLLDQERQKLEMECGAQIWEKDRQLKLVSNIVNSESSSRGTPGSRMKVPPPVAPKPRARGNMKPASSETSISTIGSSSTASSRPATRQMTKTKTPPPSQMDKPVSNRRAHRRSRSAGADRWLEHKPEQTLELETVLQPQMKKKKSVTKLHVRDVKEADRYVLTHQEMDSNDEIVTKLVKGDIVPTAGGGKQCIFNDIETLKQTSPGDKRKRQYARPEVEHGDWSDTETRCNIAMEGHGNGGKRLRQSQM